MKPFAVSCTTCRARLKVLDPAAIGQILACPKCNSMVQIVPPPDWVPGDDGASVAAGDSSPTVGRPAQPIRPAPPPVVPAAAIKTTAPTTLQSRGDAFEAVDAALLGGSAIAKRPSLAAALSCAVPILAAPISAAAKQPAKQPPIVHAAATQPTTARPAPALVRTVPISSFDPAGAAAESSRWFWPTFSAATFLALAVAGLVIYLDRHNAVSADAAALTVVAQANANPPAAAPPAVSPPPASAVADNRPAPSPLAVSRVLPAAAPQAAPPRSTAAPPVPVPPAASPPAPKPAAPIQPPPADDPLAALQQAAASASDPASEPDSKPAAVASAPVAPAPAAPAFARPSLQRVPPHNVDVVARLTDPVAGIEFQQSPLWQFLSDLSQLSTVPISLDADALAEMNLSPDMLVSLQLKNTTLGAILDQSLAARGLGWRTVGHQIEVGRPASQELRRVRYSVADIAGDTPESRRQFAEMVHLMVEPSGWSEANGSATSEWSAGALVVTADASAHAQLLMLCEKLRLARGLQLKSRVDPDRFHLESRTVHAKAALEAPITVNFARPEAFEKIVAYLRSATRLNLLIDNVALAEDGMSADSEGALIAQGQPFAVALGALLEPMELTYRVIDDRTLEITTPKAVARHVEVEFYPAGELLAAGADGQDLIARISRELGGMGAPGHAASPATIHFDAPSKYLIVRAPQSVQHRVESLLGTWRVAKQ